MHLRVIIRRKEHVCLSCDSEWNIVSRHETVIYDVQREYANDARLFSVAPVGAGMCSRRERVLT